MQTVVAVAWQLREELGALLGDGPAEGIRAQLDVLLSRADAGEDVEDELLTLLVAAPELRERLDELLPLEDGERSGYAPLPGYDAFLGDDDDGDVLVCPIPACGYAFPVFEAGEVPEPCPRHGERLVPGG